MLRIHLHNEIKCMPYESLKEAQKSLEIILKVFNDEDSEQPEIVLLENDAVDEFKDLENPPKLYVIIQGRKNREGFYDRDGYVYTNFNKPFYKHI